VFLTSFEPIRVYKLAVLATNQNTFLIPLSLLLELLCSTNEPFLEKKIWEKSHGAVEARDVYTIKVLGSKPCATIFAVFRK
jgi:hypothetical protein